MFHRSSDRVKKLRKPSKKRSFRDDAKAKLRAQLLSQSSPPSAPQSPRCGNAIATISVGPDQRLFAAHVDALCKAPYFAAALKDGSFGQDLRLHISDEEPEVLSAVLEYLYKGDYSPQLLHDRKRDTWVLEQGADMAYACRSRDGTHRMGLESVIHCRSVGTAILRDTVVYCAAGRYGLGELKRLALRKQALQSGMDVATILRSARYAYDRTPETDSRLRAHYLALIIRNRRSFRRSGTMQSEMEAGGELFFDLFVAMSNHIDDLVASGHAFQGCPRTI